MDFGQQLSGRSGSAGKSQRANSESDAGSESDDDAPIRLGSSRPSESMQIKSEPAMSGSSLARPPFLPVMARTHYQLEDPRSMTFLNSCLMNGGLCMDK